MRDQFLASSYKIFNCALCIVNCALFTACRSPKAEVVVVKEYVAVPMPPAQIPPRPVLPSGMLPKEPTLADLVRALLGDREALAAWALDLETRLKAYRKEAYVEPARK